tara:strand:- start:2307 stop:2654 length:348 start_codon:yes stop_codon:yes gene_type:complete
MIEDEVQRILQNPDHVIMSDGLELSMGETSASEYLEIDNNLLVCNLLSAKRNSKLSWDLNISVPGLTFQDFASFEKIIFRHNDLTFLLTENFEFCGDTHIKTLSAKATRIYEENE